MTTQRSDHAIENNWITGMGGAVPMLRPTLQVLRRRAGLGHDGVMFGRWRREYLRHDA
jgi:hypothetical protein